MLTSAPQPVGALWHTRSVEQISTLLPFSFAFAAGAMLCLVAVELAPQAFKRGTLPLSLAGTAAGAAPDARPRGGPRRLGDRRPARKRARCRWSARAARAVSLSRACRRPGSDSISSVPPVSSTRSRMPSSPKPRRRLGRVEPPPLVPDLDRICTILLDDPGAARSVLACLAVFVSASWISR